MCATTDAIAPAQPVMPTPLQQAPETWNQVPQATWNTSMPAPVPAPAGPPASVPVASPAAAAVAAVKAQKALRQAFWLFVIVGGLSIGLGALAELGEISQLQGLFNWYSVVEGAIFLVLAYFTWRGSLIAAIIGAALYVLDTVLLLLTGYFSIVRVAIIIGLARTIMTAYQFRQRARQLSAQPGAAPDQTRAA
ncbi:MAG TPA: hypothetical protein VFR68_09485 [Candidatus Dormibacteraeota bacterium]|nr:hypothetical protein [Candidatus Dormibacteraeota bacterium]